MFRRAHNLNTMEPEAKPRLAPKQPEFGIPFQAPRGEYLLIHDPDEPKACCMRNEHLSRLFFCPGNGCCSSQMQLYYDMFQTTKQIDQFEFDLNVVHWREGDDLVSGGLRHSLLVGPRCNATPTGPQPELFESRVHTNMSLFQIHPNQMQTLRSEAPILFGPPGPCGTTAAPSPPTKPTAKDA